MKYFYGKMMTLLVVGLSFFPPAVVADIQQQQDSIRLEEVIVESSAISGSLNSTIIEADDLQSKLAATHDAAELLKDIPGVNLYSAGGVSSLPAIHGLADDRIRVKVDGMDLISSCPNHMNPPLSYVNPADVENVQVFSGIAPVSLGGDSIGGTISLNTAKPEFAPNEETLLKGKASVFYRSNGNGFTGHLSTTAANERFSVNYSGEAAGSENYKAADNFKTTTATGHNGHTLPLDEVGSTSYEKWNHALGAAWKIENHILETKVSYQDVPEQDFPNQRMDMLGNKEYRPSLSYSGEFDWGDLEARAYYQKVDEHYMNFGDDKRFWYGALSGMGGVPCSPIGATCASGMPMYTQSDNAGVTTKADINLSAEDVLRIGGELQFYRLDDWWPPSGGGMWPGTFLNINNGKRDRMAIFTEWENQVTSDWLTQLGVRYEHVRMDAGNVTGYNPAGMGNQGRDANNFNSSDREKTDHNFDMTALSRYSVTSGFDVEFGYAHKTRSPNLYERYAWSTWSMPAVMVNWFGDGNGYVGNVNLDPEQANTLSTTFNWHANDRKWELKATPYYTRVTDYIDAIQWDAATNTPRTTLLTNQFTVLKFVNQSAQLYGFDLSGKMPLASTKFGELGLKGLLNYTNGENLDTNDGLYNIMPINSTLTLTHKQGGWENDLELVMVGKKDDVSDMRNEIRTSRYSLVNLRSSYSWKNKRLDFGIENLLDEYYSLPLGGAYTGQGMTMSLNPTDGSMAWGTAVPGKGRFIYLGMTIEF